MRKTKTSHYTGAILASMLLTAYPLILVGEHIKALTDQGVELEQIQSELQTLLDKAITDIQKRGQSSLSLRDFSENNLFSCRGLA